MAVRRTCESDAGEVELDLGMGERLLYEVEFEEGAQPTFKLVDLMENDILSSADGPDPDGVFRARWPDSDAAPPALGSDTHTLGLQFIYSKKYAYRISKLDAEGEASLLTSCTFESEPHDSNDRFFEPFDIIKE